MGSNTLRFLITVQRHFFKEVSMSEHDCLFCAILQGEEPAKVIHKDEAAQMALIQSLHP
jgi:hypothetical protein